MSAIQQQFGIPDVIGHRGYCGEYPENTLISFQEAVKAGATALEGDIRLTKDNEIIMMHDLTIQRTTNGTGAVRDHEWKHLQQFTTKEGQQPIPRLKDVLEFLDQIPDKKERGFYMIIDIKFDNPIEIMDVLSTLLQNEYSQLKDYLVIGIWNVKFLEKAKSVLEGYPLCFIGLSIPAARHHFLDQVDCFSLPFAALVDKDGHQMVEDVHALGKRIFTWTINLEEQVKSCVIFDVDGIVGDHVQTLRKLITEAESAVRDEETCQEYLASDQFLKSRRRRAYYYLLKKGMNLASSKVIGV